MLSKKLEKIYGREIIGINQGSYLDHSNCSNHRSVCRYWTTLSIINFLSRKVRRGLRFDSTLLYSTMLYYTVLYSPHFYYTLLYSTYPTCLHSPLLYSTLLYSHYVFSPHLTSPHLNSQSHSHSQTMYYLKYNT